MDFLARALLLAICFLLFVTGHALLEWSLKAILNEPD